MNERLKPPASKGEGWTGKIIDKIMEQCPILEDVPGKRLFRIMLREAIDPILKAAVDEAVEKGPVRGMNAEEVQRSINRGFNVTQLTPAIGKIVPGPNEKRSI